MIFTFTLTQLLVLLAITVAVASLASSLFDYAIDRYHLAPGPGRPRLVRTWYGTGRTVHHPILGSCRVVDVDLWVHWELSWLFIAPIDDDTHHGAWVPVTEVTETRDELRAGEDR